MAKETTERGEKSALHEVSMHFYQKRREKEKSKRKQKKPWTLTYNMNPVTIPETGISSHSHLLIILRKKIFP